MIICINFWIRMLKLTAFGIRDTTQKAFDTVQRQLTD